MSTPVSVIQAASLESLSDEIVLHIASYLSLTERLSLCRTSARFWTTCHDKSLVKYVGVSRNWNLDANTVIQEVRQSSKYIIYLDFAHCYWLTTDAILKCGTKCSNLVQLDLRGCTVTPNALDKILSVATLLNNLAVTDPSVYIKSRTKAVPTPYTKRVYCMSESACKTLKGLKELFLIITPSCTKGFFVARLCSNLTSFNLIVSNTNEICHCGWFEFDDQIRQTMQHITQLQINKNIWHPHYKIGRAVYDLFSLHSHALYDDGFPILIKKDPFTPFHLRSLAIYVHSRSRTFPNWNLGSLDKLEYFSVRRAPIRSLWIDSDSWASLLQQFSAVTSFCTSLEYIYEKSPSGSWLQPFLSLCSHLKHLNLLWTCCHGTYTPLSMDALCNAVAKCVSKDLISLALPTCFVVEQELHLQKRPNKNGPRRSRHESVLYEGPQGFGQRRRVGVSTGMSSSTPGVKSWDQNTVGRLGQFVTACPHMEEFELIAWSLSEGGILFKKANNLHCKIEHAVTDSDLVCVSKWECLSSLTLVGLPGIQHGKCLIEIMKGCRKLRYLSLAYLGLDAGCAYMQALCEALKHATNLQDLRLEQPNMRVNESLCRAIQQCSNLTRICIAAHKTQFSFDGVLGIFEQCQKLFVFHLITGSTLTACERLTKLLQDRYQRTRPALNIYISTENKMGDICRKIPLVHQMELTYLQSHVCEKPIGWKGLNPL